MRSAGLSEIDDALFDVEIALTKLMWLFNPEEMQSRLDEAANEAAGRIELAMAFGMMDEIPVENRPFIADPMQDWAILSHARRVIE